MVDSGSLAARLSNVYWIGGGSGAGKSTIARRLAVEHGLRLYSTDDVMADHARRSDPQACPLLHEFLQMEMDERWVHRSPEVMLDTFHWFRGEGFDFIVDDLLGLAHGGPVLVEGFRLLPRLVAPLLADRSHSVWLLPSPAFRRAAFTARGTIDDVPGRTGEPATALNNLLRRDELFTAQLRADIASLELAGIEVGAAVNERALAHEVAALLGLRS